MLWAYLESLYSLHFLLERESMTTVSFSTISPFNERHGRGLQILLNLPGSRYLCQVYLNSSSGLGQFLLKMNFSQSLLPLQRAIQVLSAPAFLDIHCVQGIFSTLPHSIHEKQPHHIKYCYSQFTHEKIEALSRKRSCSVTQRLSRSGVS